MRSHRRLAEPLRPKVGGFSPTLHLARSSRATASTCSRTGNGVRRAALVEAFVAANEAHDLGARIVLLTRDAARFAARSPQLANDRAVEFLVGDAVDFVPPKGRFAFVVHAATQRYHDADATRPLSVFERDFIATRRVLEFAREAGATRSSFTSSGAVYGASHPISRTSRET